MDIKNRLVYARSVNSQKPTSDPQKPTANKAETNFPKKASHEAQIRPQPRSENPHAHPINQSKIENRASNTDHTSPSDCAGFNVTAKRSINKRYPRDLSRHRRTPKRPPPAEIEATRSFKQVTPTQKNRCSTPFPEYANQRYPTEIP